MIILLLFLRRYSQVVRPWIANPLSPVRIWVSPYIFSWEYDIIIMYYDWGCGGMVDATDLNF